MAEIIFYENITRKQFFRFYDLINLVNKADGRRELTFEDKGFVDNIDVFITGCLSFFPIYFSIDSSTLNWVLLNDVKHFKTMLSFYNNEITCQGLYFKDLDGYLRHRFETLLIETTCLNPCLFEERNNAINFLSQ